MINQDEITDNDFIIFMRRCGLCCIIFILFVCWGCALPPKKLMIKDMNMQFKEGTIVSAIRGGPVSFDELIADLKESRMIYIGETHTSKPHHDIQLQIIRELYGKNPEIITVGMEMFDRTYQPILDKWSEGGLDRQSFINRTHWYANWKYDYELYSGILEFIKEKKIKLVGLNIPFHIPAKIARGGLESLSGDEKKHLPEKIDVSDKLHREYVENIFRRHKIKGMEDFEYFYVAQCVWEDIMAETASNNIKNGVMVILAGNGHVLRYGIPGRAFARNGFPYRIIFLAPVGTVADMSHIDYIWVTP
ncbi:MAG: Cofac hem bdg protein [Thermodesulfobacteriota bacterium]|nr:Cofac hem bdg protein [Thermodesulfobacteriota bacterium]